jgi:antitoxin component YwqK of YwqJK toxin-antitoxin module
MKKYLIILLLFTMNVCLAQDVVLKDSVYYKKGKLFSGYFVEKYETGAIKAEMKLRKGRVDGICTEYYESGMKKEEKSMRQCPP